MLRLLVCAALVGASAFAQNQPNQKPMAPAKKVPPMMMGMPGSGPTKSLFERLGGAPAITAVVDKFVARASTDPKVNFMRAGKVPADRMAHVDVGALKKHLVEFLTMATGGPGAYTGKDMKATHQGMKITDAEFTALAGDLAMTLDEFKVPMKEKTELMAIAGSTKKDIVETK